MSDADIQCTIGGLDVSVGQAGGYDLESATRAQRQQQLRKITATSPFVEGEYDVQAVRGNVTETVRVYVYADDQVTLRQRINAIYDRIETASYPVVWRIGLASELWDASYAEYTENIQAEFSFGRTAMALLELSIPRRPRISYSLNGVTVIR